MKRAQVIPLLILAMISLLVGIASGLQRMGWNLPLSTVVSNHGVIMVGGFIGTLITLEKIIPLERKLLYAFPLLSGASVLLFFMKLASLSIICLILTSIGLSIVFLIYLVRTPSLVYFLMLSGAICWVIGNTLLFTHGSYPLSLSWWMGFVLFVIGSERLELMNFLPVSRNQKIIVVVLMVVFLVACLFSFHGIGNYIAAISLIGVSLWLMRFDVVRINLKKQSLSRYTGIALLTGYCSLLLTGMFMFMLIRKPLGYDAQVHAFFIGFVFSMIFAHGPIILPGVLGISVKPYHPILYLWLLLLHSSWIVRVVADTVLDLSLRKYTGVASAIAILGYFMSLAIITIRSRQRAKAI